MNKRSSCYTFQSVDNKVVVNHRINLKTQLNLPGKIQDQINKFEGVKQHEKIPVYYTNKIDRNSYWLNVTEPPKDITKPVLFAGKKSIEFYGLFGKDDNNNTRLNDGEDLSDDLQKIIKQQPYIFKKIRRFCHHFPINNSLVNYEIDNISEEIIQAIKEPILEKTPKSIKFAETPQYFKVELAPEVPEDEIPTEESIYQPPIEMKDRYFDKVALELSKKKIIRFDTLIFQLINENEAVKSDFDRVRAIFTWLTNKNATESHLDYVNEGGNSTNNTDSPEMYFHGLCIGRYTYAQYFQLLCRYAGLQCKLLRGYAKGNDFKPGMKLQGGKAAQHAWNSVKIEGCWYLFDTHWTARRLLSRNRAGASSHLDLFYYMIHPEDMKFSHFPFEQKWQMLRDSMSLEEFEKLCIVKPAFFKFGLQFRSHHQSIVTTECTDIKLELGYATEKPLEKTCFTFTLRNETASSDVFQGKSLNKFGIVETVRITDRLSKVQFWIRFPEPATYKMMIFAKGINDDMFSGVCEYIISTNADPMKYNLIKCFPPTQQTTYGKTELLSKYNIESTWDNHTLVNANRDGTFEVVFKTFRKDNSESFPRIMARLRCESSLESDLSKHLLIRIDPHSFNVIKPLNETVKIKGYLTLKDEYALEIYANNPDTESSSFFLIWQHLIICDNPFKDVLPQLTPGLILGAQDTLYNLGISAISHSDPLILIDKKNIDCPYADISIRLGLLKSKTNSRKRPSIKILGQMIEDSAVNSDDEKISSSMVLQQIYLTNSDLPYDEVEFLIRLKEVGCYYRFYIYGMSASEELDTLPLVMTYLLVARPQEISKSMLRGVRMDEFPEQTSQWKEDCRLIRPMNKKILLPKLSKYKTELIELVIPEAVKVAGVIDQQWTQFESTSKDHWCGRITIDSTTSPGTKLTIYANYSEKYLSYLPLLEYELN